MWHAYKYGNGLKKLHRKPIDVPVKLPRKISSKPKKTRRRDRNRPWHEIARLQSEVVELERQVQEKSATATKKARLDLQTHITNAALKTTLRNNLNTIRALDQNLTTQIDELLQAAPHSLVKKAQNLPYDAVNDRVVFMRMAGNVDDQYRDMDQALRLAKLYEDTSEVADAVICRSNSNCGDVLKLRARLLLPFEQDCLVESLWRYLDRCEAATFGATRSKVDIPLGVSSRIAVQKFEIALGDYMCVMRMVTKQFIEKNRVVHVWNVLADWCIGATCNIKTCEQGWGFIQPINHDKVSLCLSYSLMDPTIDGYPPSGHCDALIKLYHQFMISRLQIVRLRKHQTEGVFKLKPPSRSDITHWTSSKPKKTRRRDRNRPWHEIARLQTEVEELERQLENQLAQASTNARETLATYLNNAELKALTRECIEDASALEWNVNRQMQELVQMLPRSLNMTPQNLPFVVNQDDRVFCELARSVDDQYSKMEQVLQLAGLDETISEVEDAFFCRSGLLESRTRILSPFQSSSLVESLWGMVENGRDITDCTSELPLGLACRVGAQKYQVVVEGHVCSMRAVMKQFRHENRDVMVWSVLGDWTLVGDMPNMQTHEQGWGFIQPVNANTSVCLNYSRVNSPLVAFENCGFLAKLYQEMVVTRLHMIENQSLDRVVQKKNRTKKTRRRDRNRPWHEIARLQSEVVELERQVQEKSATATKKARLDLQTHITNAALKTTLRNNLNTIRALDQNLTTQIDELLQAAPHSLVKKAQNLPYDAVNDRVVFMRMAGNVDDQYRDMDQALRLAKLYEDTSEVTDAVICRSNSNCGDVLKSRARLLLPFEQDCLVESLWRYLDRCEAATFGATRSKVDIPLGVSSRIAVQKFEIALGDYVCVMRMVTKQFIEKNRVVHVWNVLADWCIGATCNIKTCEQGWGFIQPINHDKVSLCLSYSLMDPTIDGYPPSGHCDALIKLYHQFMISRLQVLENQTLDQIMQDEKKL
ncbi:hypothetical protein P3T76_010261 [Phytophthora citrophthora]|uniref:Uncharacterized protein n=1 Tax=Phytophthora citrophthora TaxID=4793 RepID=A0AAD9GC03_9STRA|nr:hypothetical protein P3T76_010261 [Phytophthora citrophthora]